MFWALKYIENLFMTLSVILTEPLIYVKSNKEISPIFLQNTKKYKLFM